MASYTEEYIAKLLFLELQGIADESQKKELAEWRATSPRHEEIYLRLSKQEHWEKSLRRSVKGEDEHERRWQRLNDRLVRPERISRSTWAAYAAAIVLLVGVACGIFYYADDVRLSGTPLAVVDENIRETESRAILTLANGIEIDLKNEMELRALSSREPLPLVDNELLSYRIIPNEGHTDEYHTLTVPRGGEYVLILSDGSKVYLNAESKLTYPVCFNGSERKVYLEGEAYFNIEKDTKKPFIVEASPLKVEVTGTTFGVRAYREEEDIQTTLESGKVNVWLDGEKAELSPGKQALFNKTTTALEVCPVDTELFLAWKDGRLVFDNCPLEKILSELSRWYAFDVFYGREEVKGLNFSLNMQKHTAFAEVLDLIAATKEVGFEIKNRTVIVK